jgi:putative flippase GtrA
VKRSSLGKIIRFGIVGGISTLIDFGVYMVLSNHIDITVSKMISMAIACIFSFFVQKLWTFANKNNVQPKMVVLFIISQLINIAVNTSTNTLCFNITANKIISFVIATGVAMVVNYLLQNFIVFPAKKKNEKKKVVKKHSFSIVIPCYNEAENLEKLVAALKKFPKRYDVEFILVENGSTDNSRKLFRSMKDIDGKRIKKVYVDENKGYGFGIISGLRKAKNEFVGWLHADLQYDPAVLANFFDYIDQSKNEKILMKGQRRNRHVVEYIFTFGMGVYDSLLFKKHMSNVMAMPVIFNRELLDYIDDYPEDFTIDIFAYALAQKRGYEVAFLPVTLKDREGGKSSWNTGFASRVKQSFKMMRGSKMVKKQLKEIK